MKNLFMYIVFSAIAAMGLASCGQEKEVPNPSSVSPQEKVSFTDAQMYYYYDDFGTGAGSYGLSLYSGARQNPDFELYLDFTSTPFSDMSKAVPAEGVYILSDSYAEFTFNDDYSWYFVKYDNSNSTTHYLASGRFTMEEDGSGHYVHFEVELADGTILSGDFRGEIAGMNNSELALMPQTRIRR